MPPHRENNAQYGEQSSVTNQTCRLTAGSLLLFFGSVADLFGRKSMFILSMLLFSIFSLGAGFSQTGMTLDILCGVLGIFSAAAVPPAQGMLGVIYEKPSQRKNRAFGCFSAGNPMGFIFGTILAGLFTQLFNWRAGFFLLAIVYFCISVVATFTVPKDTIPKQTLNSETIKKLDLPGTALTIFGIGMFCAALRYGRVLRFLMLQANILQSWRDRATGLEDTLCSCSVDSRGYSHICFYCMGVQVSICDDRYENLER
jgi:MFS family permease